jgi:hypothetical protein
MKTSRFSVKRILSTCVISLSLFFLYSFKAEAQERMSCYSTGPNSERCRVDEPNVRLRQELVTIRFRPGDRITVDAGGCVQTGGVGATWKRYVNPSGPNSDRLYHGLIYIPYATTDFPRSPTVDWLVRIEDVIGRTLFIPERRNVPNPQLLDAMTLGYEDDDYGDNGYWGHDDGTGDQCRGVGPAYVILNINHSVEPAPTVRAPVNLTGAWQADDGAVYFMRQVGRTVWWTGLSNDGGSSFTNVFRGEWHFNSGPADPADYGSITGEWADLPRGTSAQYGTLTIRAYFSGELRKISQTGGFGGSVWRRAPIVRPVGREAREGFPSRGGSLTGVWSATDQGTYYLRQVGNTVWWLGVSSDDGWTFANIFRGTVEGNTITGDWSDVPRGVFQNGGVLRLNASGGSASLSLTSVGASLAGYVWTRR